MSSRSTVASGTSGLTLPLISIGGYYVDGKTLADYGREMEMYRDAGMAGCKFKVGGLSPEEDAKRVAAARKGAGPDFTIAVDANRGWTAADAARFAKLIEPHDIAWFEEPCHWYDDAAMMAQVRQASRIPVTAGQSEITSQGGLQAWGEAKATGGARVRGPLHLSTGQEAVAAGGSSLRDHRQADGSLGYFQHTFRVYDREGEPCPNCGSPIERLVQSGRSTFFCSECQR